MKAPEKHTQKPRRARLHPLGRLELRVDLTQDEILADLFYPAPARRARSTR